MPVRSRLKSVPPRLDDEAIARIVTSVGSVLTLEPDKSALKEDLNFERIHFASFDIVGKKGSAELS
jgi:hypothetical protein